MGSSYLPIMGCGGRVVEWPNLGPRGLQFILIQLTHLSAELLAYGYQPPNTSVPLSFLRL